MELPELVEVEVPSERAVLKGRLRWMLSMRHVDSSKSGF